MATGRYRNMLTLLNFPLLVLVLSFFVMSASAQTGLILRRKQLNLEEDAHKDLDLIVGATLTLLGLIIGFSFSMAISRYDQRKNYEEEEANAMAQNTSGQKCCLPRTLRKCALLTKYLDQRVLFYETRDESDLSADRCRHGATADPIIFSSVFNEFAKSAECGVPFLGNQVQVAAHVSKAMLVKFPEHFAPMPRAANEARMFH